MYILQHKIWNVKYQPHVGNLGLRKSRYPTQPETYLKWGYKSL